MLQLEAQRSQVICLIPQSHLVATSSIESRVFHISAQPTLRQAATLGKLNSRKRQVKEGHSTFSDYLLFQRAVIYMWMDDVMNCIF